jgi:hypothetical protein
MIVPHSVRGSEFAKLASRPHDNSNYHFHLEQRDEMFFLSSSPGSLVARLNERMAGILRQILTTEHIVQFYAYVPRQTWHKLFGPSRLTEKNAIFDGNINISGDISFTHAAGEILSANHVYLQRPIYLAPGELYHNPQHVTFPGIEPQKQFATRIASETEDSTKSSDEAALTKDHLNNEFAIVFNSLTRSHCLSEIDADKRIKTNLLP